MANTKDILARVKQFEKEFGKPKFGPNSPEAKADFKPIQEFFKSEKKSPLAKVGGEPLMELPAMSQILSPITGTPATPQAAPTAQKPEYKLPGPDGVLGTDDDEINPKYKKGVGRNVLAGFSLGGQLGAKESQNVFYQLGAMLGGGVAGLINPELAGKASYQKDLGEYFATTDAELKRRAQMADIEQKAARTTYTQAQAAFRNMQITSASDENQKQGLYQRVGFDLDTLTSPAPYLTTQDKAESEARLRKDLDMYFKSINYDVDVTRATADELVDYANNLLVDPKADSKQMGFFYYKRNRLGRDVLVTENGQALTSSNYATFLMNQIKEKSKEKNKENALTAQDTQRLWKQAEEMVVSEGAWRTDRSGRTPDTYTRNRVAAYFEALSKQEIKTRGGQGAELDEDIYFPLPDGTFQKRKASDLFKAQPAAAATSTSTAGLTKMSEEEEPIKVATVALPPTTFATEGFNQVNTQNSVSYIERQVPQAFQSDLVRSIPASRDRRGRPVPARKELTDLGKLYSAAAFSNEPLVTVVSNQIIPHRNVVSNVQGTEAQRKANALQIAGMLSGLRSYGNKLMEASDKDRSIKDVTFLASYDRANKSLTQMALDLSGFDLPQGVGINDVTVESAGPQVLLTFDNKNISKTETGDYQTGLVSDDTPFVLKKENYTNLSEIDKMENGTTKILTNKNGVSPWAVRKYNGKLYLSRIMTFEEKK